MSGPDTTPDRPASHYPADGECQMSDHGACGHFGWCAVCPEKPKRPGQYMADVGVLVNVG